MSAPPGDFSISSYLNYTVFRKENHVEDEVEPSKARPHIVLKISDQRLWTIQLSSEISPNTVTVGNGTSDCMIKCKMKQPTCYLVNNSLQTMSASHYSEQKNYVTEESKNFLLNHIADSYFRKHKYYSGLAMKCSRIPIAVDSNGSRHFNEQVVIVISARTLKSFQSLTVCPVYYFRNSINSIEIKCTDNELQHHDGSSIFSRFSGLNEMWIDLTQVYTYRSGGKCCGGNVLEFFQNEPRLLNPSIDLVIGRLREILFLKLTKTIIDQEDDEYTSDFNQFRGLEVNWAEEAIDGDGDSSNFTANVASSSEEEDFGEECSYLNQFVDEQKSREVSISFATISDL